MSCQPLQTFSLKSILAEMCMLPGGILSQTKYGKMIGQRNPETNPITIKPETTSHLVEQLTWVPLLPAALFSGTPSQKFLLCHYVYLLGQFIFHYQTRAHSWALKGFPSGNKAMDFCTLLSTLRFQKITWYTYR